jgi:predicted dehydrogenase
MKNFLVVGFGGMGCRHAQSILDAKLTERIFVIEPSDEIFETNLKRIGFNSSAFVRLKSVDEISVLIDLAVVATSSEPRFEITRQLISKGVQTFLLEKVVFQSIDQFIKISDLSAEKTVRIFGNLPNRYFDNYIEIKKHILKTATVSVNMTVVGGEFGLACNAIHYLDLFAYLTGYELENNNSRLNVSETPNRRGVQYRELNGFISFKDKNGRGSLMICSEKNFKGGVTVSISVDTCSTTLYESEQVEFRMLHDAEVRSFMPIPSSKLTARIITDIGNDKCLMPELDEMMKHHSLLFNEFNLAFNLNKKNDTICPIT